MSPIGFAILSGAGVIREAGNGTNIFVHTVFKAPIDSNGIVRIDLETAGDAHDVVISPDGPMFGTVLDDADAGIDFLTVNEANVRLVAHCGDTTVGGFTQPFSTGDSDCANAVSVDTCKHQYSITEDLDLEIDFGKTVGAKYAGRTMMIDCYTVRRSGAMEMFVDAEHFGGNFYVEASTLFRDQATGEDLAAEFIIPNAKIQSNFTFNMASSGDPSSFDFVMDAFPAYTKFDKTHKCLCALQIIGGEQGEAAADNSGNCPDDTPESYPVTEVVVGADKSIWTFGKVIGTKPDTSEGAAEDATVDVKIEDLFVPTPTDQDELDAALASLGRNLSADISALDIDFSGTLVSGINFSEDSGFDSTGYYIPVAFKPAENGVFDVDSEGNVGEKKDSVTLNGYETFIYEVDQNKPVNSVKIGNYYYALDFSNINFA